MKKIAANEKRAVKRAMSPPCQLISSVVLESSTVDDSATDDSLTAYAGFLLEQHKATQNNHAELVVKFFKQFIIKQDVSR